MCKLRSIRVIAVFEDGSRSNHEYHGNPHLTAAQIRQRIDNLLCDWYEIQARREFDALRRPQTEYRGPHGTLDGGGRMADSFC